MSSEGDRAAVFRTTKVRTKIKGDCSWMQQRGDPEPEAQEDKPWIAEVRASRLNGDPVETSPVSSPTSPSPSPNKPAPERAPASGYLIRGVFTKTESSPAPSSASNGFSGTTHNFTKRPSETYKKIAPHTVRPTPEIPDQTRDQLSPEEQQRRTEAASNVLKRSAARQRSYVLSAAKKYESTEPDTSPVNSSPSFVAKRVEIADDDDDDDDDETAVSPASASPQPATSVPTNPVPSPATDSEPTAQTAVEARVTTNPDTTADESPEEDFTPEPTQELPPAVTLKDDTLAETEEKETFIHMKPGCTKVATPLPVLRPVFLPDFYGAPEPDNWEVSEKNKAPAPSPFPECPVAEKPVKTNPEPEPCPSQSSNHDTLSALADTLISFNTSSDSLLATQDEENDVSDPSVPVPDSDEREPTPEPSNCVEMTDDLLALSDCEEELPEPMPPSPGRWSQDLLSGPDSVSVPTKTSDILDLLSDDVIPINTGSNSLSTQHEEEKQTDETAEDTRSTEDSIDSWSSHVTTSTVAESSSADPFDPYPIGTTSPNSSSDLLQPLPTPSINSSTELLSKTHLAEEEPSPDTSLSHDALEALAEDVIPIKTDATSLSTNRRAWTHTWDTGKPEYTTAEERQEDEPAGWAEDQHTPVMFERKSAGSDSPWDRWTSPTVYTTATTTEEEGESYDGVVPKTSDREDDQRAEMPELESKKGFVCVKEYVNASELSLHNASDDSRGGSDYSTSSASSYTCSSPSTYSRGSMSSTCTYCGEPVGNEGKITIEHLNINCHPSCFKCGVCGKPMGDLLCSMFLHGGTVHCESCYSKTFD